MSDENPPPPLRLKPRLRPSSETAPDFLAAIDESATELFQPKPLMDVTAGFALPGAPPPEPAPAPRTPPPPSPSAVLLPVLQPPIVEPPIFKFKLKASGPIAPPAPTTASFPSIASSGPVFAAATPPSPPQRTPPPSFPGVADAKLPGGNFPPHTRVPHVRAPAHSGEADRQAPPSEETPRPRRSIKQTVLIAACLIIFICLGVTYHTLTAPPPSPQPPPTGKPSPLAAAQLTPSATLNQIAATPAAAINKARDAVGARRGLEQNRLDALVAGEEPSDQRALPTPPPGTFAPKPTSANESIFSPATSTAQLAPGVTAAISAAVVGGNASPAFRAWVANARINGVFQGKPSRALINGRTIRVGQIVDDVLGITFDGVNIDMKTILFRDRTGSTVTRKF